jgi:alpha-ketoglutarate-dependent taurine dioxygenase
MLAGGRGPLLVRPGTRGNTDLAPVVRERRAWLEDRLGEHGALLFRGFDVGGTAGFASLIDSLPYARIDYTYRSTPRTTLSRGVYTATEYPADRSIPLHNENSYQRDWPMKLAFYCERKARTGGRTPVADMRRVTEAVGKDLVDEFAERRVQYVRHYRAYVDLSWQTVFQCSDRRELAEFCAAHDIAHTWLDADTLRTSQVCQGVAVHPLSKERVLFNQAHLFHSSSLGPEHQRSLVEHFGRDRLPRHARYGDGGEIPERDLERVRSAFDRGAMSFAWEEGDVLLLDNMQFAHGREPYTGGRRVLAALLDPHGTSLKAVP